MESRWGPALVSCGTHPTCLRSLRDTPTGSAFPYRFSALFGSRACVNLVSSWSESHSPFKSYYTMHAARIIPHTYTPTRLITYHPQDTVQAPELVDLSRPALPGLLCLLSPSSTSCIRVLHASGLSARRALGLPRPTPWPSVCP